MKDKSRSERILAEVKRRRDNTRVVEVEEEKVKLVIFTLGSECYAFPGSDVKEILRFDTVTYVPGSPETILGIINVRGDIESVLNLHKVLGLSDSRPSHGTRIIVAASADVRSGILVDTVEDVLDIPASSVQPPLSTLDRSVKEYVSGETTYGDRNVTILGAEKILGMIAV